MQQAAKKMSSDRVRSITLVWLKTWLCWKQSKGSVSETVIGVDLANTADSQEAVSCTLAKVPYMFDVIRNSCSEWYEFPNYKCILRVCTTIRLSYIWVVSLMTFRIRGQHLLWVLAAGWGTKRPTVFIQLSANSQNTFLVKVEITIH